MKESVVKLPDDSANLGPKIRNESSETVQPDGTTAVTQTQVVRLAEHDRALLADLGLTAKRQLAALFLLLQAHDIDPAAADALAQTL